MNGKLHHYTADTKDRPRIHIILFLLGTISAWGMIQAFTYLKIQPYWWIEIPAPLGFYGILFTIFNSYLWRLKFIRVILFIETPDLNGEYVAELKSSFDNFVSVKKAHYEIHQKWNKILIFSETDASYSKSLSASFCLSDVNRKSLVFQYQNSPKATAPTGLNIHYGFAEFCFENASLIKGEYFNGRARNTYGTIELKKIN
jgi:SMODS-associating 2TM, beta-strand rich effector domain